MRQDKFSKSIVYQVIIIFLLSVVTIGPPALADGADAELHNVEVIASPSSQGLNGVILVDAAVYIFGGCCYHLYANEVKANLTVPEGIEIIEGPTPKEYDEVDAQPGGTATVVHFKWSIVGKIKGTYNLSVKIETKNCGSVKGMDTIEIVEGCSISHPNIYPDPFRVGRENIIFITVATSLEGRYVKEVTMFYVIGEELKEGEPKNDTLYFKDDREIKGNAIILEQDQFMPEKWMCKLETESSDKIYFWFVAKDDTGVNTTSSIFEKDVVDQKAIDSMVGTIFWGLIIGIIVGIILIFLVQDIYSNRKEQKTSILRLTTGIEEEKTNGINREMITIAFIILFLVIIVLAIIFGLVEEIIELSMG